MGSVPHHPFFLKVIDSLPRYDRSWVLPYITVMGSTGPLFLSIIWRHYNSGAKLAEADRVRVLFPDEYSKHQWSFFTHHVGSSWHKNDVKVIMWVCICSNLLWFSQLDTDPICRWAHIGSFLLSLASLLLASSSSAYGGHTDDYYSLAAPKDNHYEDDCQYHSSVDMSRKRIMNSLTVKHDFRDRLSYINP
jgi:hypothetical protein